jgi:flagellar M-ring protein FliF
MNGGTTLNSGEVASIRYLISSAVPGLKVDAVTIIDNNGRLLARGGEDGDAGLYASNSNEYKTNYEKMLQMKIVEMLEKFVGMGNIQAQVTADIDFDRIVTNSEIYDPEGAVVRSVQSTEENETTNSGGQGGEVSVANNLPGGQAPTNAAGGAADKRQRVDEVTNFEITKTIKNHVSETGKVNKLSIAVLLDGTYVENPETKVTEYQPRSEEELKKLQDIIQQAVGFDTERGDSLTVANMQFSPEFSGFKSENVLDWVKEDLQNIIQIMVMGLVAILVILMVIRPLVKRAIEVNMAQQGILPSDGSEPYGLLSGPAGAMAGVPQIVDGKVVPAQAQAGGDAFLSGDGGDEDGFSILDGIQGKQKPSSIKQINEIISNSPEEALATLRSWMYGEAVA